VFNADDPSLQAQLELFFLMYILSPDGCEQAHCTPDALNHDIRIAIVPEDAIESGMLFLGSKNC